MVRVIFLPTRSLLSLMRSLCRKAMLGWKLEIGMSVWKLSSAPFVVWHKSLHCSMHFSRGTAPLECKECSWNWDYCNHTPRNSNTNAYLRSTIETFWRSGRRRNIRIRIRTGRGDWRGVVSTWQIWGWRSYRGCRRFCWQHMRSGDWGWCGWRWRYSHRGSKHDTNFVLAASSVHTSTAPTTVTALTNRYIRSWTTAILEKWC